MRFCFCFLVFTCIIHINMHRVQLEQLVEAQAVAEEGLASPGKVCIHFISFYFLYLLRTNWRHASERFIAILLVGLVPSKTLITLMFNIDKFIVCLFFIHRLSPTWRMLTTPTPSLPCAKRFVSLFFLFVSFARHL